MSRFGRRIVGVLGAVVVAVCGGVACCAPRLALWSMTPSTSFSDTNPPPAPDYTRDDAWDALPGIDDDSDRAIPALPSTKTPSVDVFYLHPTTSIAPRWNQPWRDPEIDVASARGGTLIQASAFNGTGVVYAPRYRQASGRAFTQPDDDGARAIELAYGDIVQAFGDFERRAGTTRPFVVVGHSQGSVLGERLLREHILPDEGRRRRLVAAYLLGAPIVEDDALRGCRAATEIGCVVAYNARGPGHVPNEADFGAVGCASTAPKKTKATTTSTKTSSPWTCGRGWGSAEASRLCVNPTLGRVSDEVVPATHHAGAVFLDSERPALLPRFLASQCRAGRLVVTEVQPLPQRDAMSAVLLWVLGGENYHPIEVQLMWADLRQDVARRSTSWLSSSTSTALPP
jgi:pimeloyl-ACP methyl ester carboxylesterase